MNRKQKSSRKLMTNRNNRRAPSKAAYDIQTDSKTKAVSVLPVNRKAFRTALTQMRKAQG